MNVYEVQIDALQRKFTDTDEPDRWIRFYERCVTDSPERALAMVEHYRTTWPAPLAIEFAVVAVWDYAPAQPSKRDGYRQMNVKLDGRIE